MKIILFGFDSKRLFPEETPREEFIFMKRS